MDSNTFLIAAGAINGLVLLGGLRIWLGYRERRAARTVAQERSVAAELQELRTAVEVVALEVERLGEGQRFVTRALVDRGALPPTVPHAPQGRVVTPH